MEDFFGLPGNSAIPSKHAKVLRGPHQIAFDITNRCNFRCLHCFNRSGENIYVETELSDEEVLNFIKDISQLQPFNLCFCGGEPLLREKILLLAAEVLAAEATMVSLVTNGFLVTKEIAKRLLGSGVRRVQVSLDGSTAISHDRLRQKNGSFEHAVRAITYFKEIGYEDISVAFCPTIFNYFEIEQAYYLCIKLGVSDFRVQPLMILGRTQINKQILPSVVIYRMLVKKINKLKFEQCKTIPIEWGDPVDHLIRFATLTEHCINFSDVKADGSICVSPYLPLTVGNVRRHRFSEYWEAGLARIWECPRVKEMASRIRSVFDFGKREKHIPTVWFEEDIKLDLIDDKLIH